MGSYYEFLKWKLDTEMEQTKKRKQFKMKHSTLHKLVSQHDFQRTAAAQASETEPINADLVPDTTPSKNRKKISKKLRRLLKDPSISEDIIRYQPGSPFPFKLSDHGIWKSDTTIQPEESDLKDAEVSNAGSKTSISERSLGMEIRPDIPPQNNQKCWKDDLYLWWLKNFGIRFDNIKRGDKANNTSTEPSWIRWTFKPVHVGRKSGNSGTTYRVVKYVQAAFTILIALKTIAQV